MNNDKSYKDNYNPTASKVLVSKIKALDLKLQLEILIKEYCFQKEDNCLPFAGKYGIGILLKST